MREVADAPPHQSLHNPRRDALHGIVLGGAGTSEALDETMANLEEAVALYLDREDFTELDLAPNPSLLVTFEVEPIANAG